MASATGPAWSHGRLNTKRGYDLCKQVDELLLAIIASPVLHDALDWLLSATRTEFKEASHEGAIWEARYKRWYDAGNWCYALLYQLIWRLSTMENLLVHGLLQRIGEMYACLHCKHTQRQGLQHDSKKMLVLKGDVVEVALGLTYYDGPEIPPQLVREKQEFNKLVARFDRVVDEIFRLVCPLHFNGTPPSSKRGQVDLWAQLITTNLFMNKTGQWDNKPLCQAGRWFNRLVELLDEEATELLAIHDDAEPSSGSASGGPSSSSS